MATTTVLRAPTRRKTGSGKPDAESRLVCSYADDILPHFWRAERAGGAVTQNRTQADTHTLCALFTHISFYLHNI